MVNANKRVGYVFYCLFLVKVDLVGKSPNNFMWLIVLKFAYGKFI